MMAFRGLLRGFLTIAAGFCALVVGSSEARGGAICGYQVTHVFHGPFCSSSGYYPPIIAGGISPNGRYVCGNYTPCAIGNERAYFYDTQTSQFTVIPLPQGITQSFGNAVNDSGVVVGSWSGPAGSFGYVYDLHTGQYTNLPSINVGGTCSARAITNSGMVCGVRSIGSKSNPASPKTAFRWTTSAGFEDVGILIEPGSSASCVNSNGTVVGSAGQVATASQRGFIFENGRTTLIPPIPGGASSGVSRVNEAGVTIIGGFESFQMPITTHLYLVEGNDWRELLPLAGWVNAASGCLGSDGTVAGWCRWPDDLGMELACIWRDEQPINLLNRVVGNQNLYFSRCVGIDNNGAILVTGYDPGEHAVFIVSPVATTAGDTDCNGIVDIDDLVNVITHWGPCYGCDTDQDETGTVDIDDLVQVIIHWTT